MTTAAEKADDFMRYLDQPRDSFRAHLIIILKQQDRDTRHACAEAVISLRPHPGTESLINKDLAHNVCMNVKAV